MGVLCFRLLLGLLRLGMLLGEEDRKPQFPQFLQAWLLELWLELQLVLQLVLQLELQLMTDRALSSFQHLRLQLALVRHQLSIPKGKVGTKLHGEYFAPNLNSRNHMDTHTHVDEIMTTWPKKMHELLTFMSQCLHDNTRNMDRIEVMKQGQNVMTYNPHHVMPCLIVAILCHAFPIHSVMPCYAIHDQQTSQKQVRPRFDGSDFYAGCGPSSENTPQV